MKIAFNRSQIAKVANQLKKMGYTLSQAFKTAWSLAKDGNKLNTLVDAIKAFHNENLALIAQVINGNFTFSKKDTGEVRVVKNATVFSISIQRDLALFQEHDENGFPFLNEKGKPAIRSFKISHLIAA